MGEVQQATQQVVSNVALEDAFCLPELPNLRDMMLRSSIPPDIDLASLRATVSSLIQVWCYPTEDQVETTKRHQVLFGTEPTEIRTRYKTYCEIVSSVERAMVTSPRIKLGEGDEEFIQKSLERIQYAIYSGFHAMIHLKLVSLANDPRTMGAVATQNLQSFFTMFDHNYALKEEQHIIRYYLETCNRHMFRRKGAFLYKPLFTQDGKYTQFYTVHGPIKEFVYDVVYPFEQNIKLFCILTKNRSVIPRLVSWLQCCRDSKLPELQINRMWWSFSNGVFDASNLTFYPFVYDPEADRCATELDRRYTSVNFFPHEFNIHLYKRQSRLPGGRMPDPYLIETPAIHSILTVQNYPDDVCRWVYIMLGRILWPVNKRDKWQVFFFLKGLAGTGKSTLLRLVNCLYQAKDVGILMNRGRVSFPLQHLVGKLAFFCYDLDSSMTLDRTTWNQMVSGESVSVGVMYKDTVQLDWEIPGAFAGNTDPPWIDAGGSVARRFFILEFMECIRNRDPQLYTKAQMEMPAFLYKIAAMYYYASERYSDVDIWDEHKSPVPKFFRDTRRRLTAHANPIFAFLEDDMQCIRGKTEHCAFEDFKQRLIKFSEDYGIQTKPRLSDFRETFKLAQITIVDPRSRNPEDHFGYDEPYLVGVGLAAM